MTYELYIPPKRKPYNTKNGQFLKGSVPWNKGKKWSDYASKRAQKRMAKGWKNLETHRPKTRPDNAGRCALKVAAIDDEGNWCVFPSIAEAARWLKGNTHNIIRCCKCNETGVRRRWRGTNTDHRYKGFRWYYESDEKWTNKIKPQ